MVLDWNAAAVIGDGHATVLMNDDGDVGAKPSDCFIETVTKNIKKNDGVRLVGFGTFKASKRKARVGRNPQTGAPIKIKACNVVKFKAGKALKEAV